MSKAAYRIFGKYRNPNADTIFPTRRNNPQNPNQITAYTSRSSKRYIENAVLPFSPYPRLFILSAVSIAFSSAHVTDAERIVTAVFVREIRLPLDTSLPIHRCVSATENICALNLGTNRRDMLSTRDSDGIIFPKRYINLSDVITRLNDTNHKSIVTSITPDEMPYKILSRVRGLPLLKYIRIVCPSWLNAGLIKAVTRMDGRQNFSMNIILFLPSVLIQYTAAHISDIACARGCVRQKEKHMTKKKYRKFTKG